MRGSFLLGGPLLLIPIGVGVEFFVASQIERIIGQVEVVQSPKQRV